VIAMPCVSPDGKLTESGIATLKSIKTGAVSPNDIAAATGRQLFLVRSGLRELAGAGLIKLNEEKYQLTAAGEKTIQ
jgi:predicted transcriptional regulator